MFSFQFSPTLVRWRPGCVVLGVLPKLSTWQGTDPRPLQMSHGFHIQSGCLILSSRASKVSTNRASFVLGQGTQDVTTTRFLFPWPYSYPSLLKNFPPYCLQLQWEVPFAFLQLSACGRKHLSGLLNFTPHIHNLWITISLLYNMLCYFSFTGYLLT